MPIAIELDYDQDVVDQLMQRLGRNFPKVVAVGVHASLLGMVADVTKNKLLGQVLNRRTGTLIRSITASPKVPTVTRTRVVGVFGSNLEYARLHELGFVGSVTVRQHNRRLFRTRSKTGAKLKSKQFQGASTSVKEHARNLNVRARHFLRDTLTEGKTAMERRIKRAFTLAVRTGGRVPRTRDVL